MEKEYFVFEYYTSDAMSKTCLVGFQVIDGRLKEIFERTDPQEKSASEWRSRLVEVLRERNVSRLWSCNGSTMYDEVLGLVTHFSGGEGKYSFHYESCVGQKIEGIEIQEFVFEGFSEEEKEKRRLSLAEWLC